MKEWLREEILCEIQNGYENFICGMVFGFDTMVVEMTVKLKISRTSRKYLDNHKQIDIESSLKTKSSFRQISLNQPLIKCLKILQQDKNEYALSNKYGNKVDYRSYQQSFSRLLKKLKISHYSFRSLRHTFATRLLEKVVDIKTISELHEHSNSIITMERYIHSNLENKKKAMKKLKIV